VLPHAVSFLKECCSEEILFSEENVTFGDYLVKLDVDSAEEDRDVVEQRFQNKLLDNNDSSTVKTTIRSEHWFQLMQVVEKSTSKKRTPQCVVQCAASAWKKLTATTTVAGAEAVDFTTALGGIVDKLSSSDLEDSAYDSVRQMFKRLLHGIRDFGNDCIDASEKMIIEHSGLMPIQVRHAQLRATGLLQFLARRDNQFRTKVCFGSVEELVDEVCHSIHTLSEHVKLAKALDTLAAIPVGGVDDRETVATKMRLAGEIKLKLEVLGRVASSRFQKAMSGIVNIIDDQVVKGGGGEMYTFSLEALKAGAPFYTLRIGI
jgi:hypothetical protein